MDDCKELHRPGLHQYQWPSGLTIIVQRYHQHRDGRKTAEVVCRNEKNENRPHLYHDDLNLGSGIARKKWAVEMNERFPMADWLSVAEYICGKSIGSERAGEPAVELTGEITPSIPGYQVWPFAPKGKPAVFFGDGGVGKGFVANLLGLLVAAGVDRLGLRVEKGGVLYLDWETDREEQDYRLWLLRNGLRIKDAAILYRRCLIPLADDLAAIQRQVLDGYVSLVICDSVAGACGGDLLEAESALRFINAFRELGTTGLWITHNAKDPSQKRKSAFGSAYFTNMARSVWEVQGSQEPGSPVKHIALFHRKVNMGSLLKPVGLELTFSDTAITINREDIMDVAQFAENADLWSRLADAVRTGARTVKQLSEELGETEKKLYTYLDRDDGRRFQKIEGTSPQAWGLRNHPTAQ